MSAPPSPLPLPPHEASNRPHQARGRFDFPVSRPIWSGVQFLPPPHLLWISEERFWVNMVNGARSTNNPEFRPRNGRLCPIGGRSWNALWRSGTLTVHHGLPLRLMVDRYGGGRQTVKGYGPLSLALVDHPVDSPLSLALF
ncbi:unnamed protein product [Cuscuta campestris]|uniref:Uncharacterized protein n=1 Tax=Cuscuta campestris TaxID=132261 RepID=A0A484KJ01_9ASTE|nr:unnamed protein product [Cuscuta campestris]